MQLDTSEFSLGTLIYKPFNTFQWNTTTPPGPKECQLSHFMAEMPNCKAFKDQHDYRADHKLCELEVITLSPWRSSRRSDVWHTTHPQFMNIWSLGDGRAEMVCQEMVRWYSRNVICLHIPGLDLLLICVCKMRSNLFPSTLRIAGHANVFNK